MLNWMKNCKCKFYLKTLFFNMIIGLKWLKSQNMLIYASVDKKVVNSQPKQIKKKKMFLKKANW